MLSETLLSFMCIGLLFSLLFVLLYFGGTFLFCSEAPQQASHNEPLIRSLQSRLPILGDDSVKIVFFNLKNAPLEQCSIS